MTTLTRKGSGILASLFAEFAEYYQGTHPGCNFNDIERGFLSMLGLSLTTEGAFSQEYFDTVVRPQIDEIR